MTGFLSAADALLRAHGLSFLALALTFTVAHWQLLGFCALVFVSTLNRLMPGHPMLAGAARRAMDLLAFSPMKNGRSAAFSWVAAKLGDNFAGAIFDGLSKWLNVPLSPSVATQPPLEVLPSATAPTSAGFVSRYALVFILAASVGCAFVQKEFGPTIGADEKACAMAGLHDAELRVAGIIMAGTTSMQTQIDGLVSDLGRDTVICAVQAAIADFEKAHSDAGVSAPTSARALVAFGPTDTDGAIERGYQVLERLKAQP